MVILRCGINFHVYFCKFDSISFLELMVRLHKRCFFWQKACLCHYIEKYFWDIRLILLIHEMFWTNRSEEHAYNMFDWLSHHEKIIANAHYHFHDAKMICKESINENSVRKTIYIHLWLHECVCSRIILKYSAFQFYNAVFHKYIIKYWGDIVFTSRHL